MGGVLKNFGGLVLTYYQPSSAIFSPKGCPMRDQSRGASTGVGES